MPCEECITLGIPEILCSDGKDHPIPYEIGELIFRRHNQPGTEAQLKQLSESEIGNKIFKLLDDSFNRSSLSVPEQVLLNNHPDDKKGPDFYQSWGIISLPVDDVITVNEQFRIDNQNKVCTLQVVHTVEECNYSHSEIFFYVDGVKWDGQAPKVARPFFRRQLQKLISTVKEI